MVANASIGWTWTEKAALWALLGFTLVAVLGYGVYGLHPQFIPPSEFGFKLFAISFQLFARIHIGLAALVLFLVLFRRLGTTWVLPFGLVYGLSFCAEHIGTGYGVPFGGYEYTGLLGAKLGGRVPFLIPISWFLMALPSWVLARHALRGPEQALGRIALASMWLVVWDLALDPAMSFLTPYWMWEDPGSYYGMPLINLLGWYVTGVALMAVIEGFSSRVRWVDLDTRWMAAYYCAMLAMPLGMLIAAGLWLGVVVTLVAVASASWLTALLGGRETAGRVEPASSPGGARV
jgi:uncharacterized membrane protein